MSAFNTEAYVEQQEIVVKRTFRAPRELVFDAFTDPNHLAMWWGPIGFSTTTSRFEARPNGQWEYVMHGPDGTAYPNLITYREVVRPERLVYSHGEPGDEEQFRVTVTLEDRNGDTALSMHSRFRSAEQLRQAVENYGAVEGGKQTIARLAELVERLASPKN
ncbi:SRPBCC family protein [Paenibacillus sp.]|uniref:SRPBCC family protein n=1 Tax=Paenibacillus sp. TaxID=58172 RepID=UPI0028121A36|nr:SRPBCC family protein [Paenibacillus sp.]